MSDSKKYYWLKLQKTFFSDKKMKKMRLIAGGEIYTIIYLKLLLESLDNGGLIEFENICDNPAEELSLMIDETADNIKACLVILEKLKLCEYNDNFISFNDIQDMIGSITTAGIRKSEQRKRIEQKTMEGQQEDNVPTLSQKCPPEIEREKEKDTDKDTEREKEPLANDEVEILLNHTQFLSFEDFEKVYIFWFTKLTGKPVTLLHQTVSANEKNIEQLNWLRKNFEARKVHAGIAIFETLEYIAQDKTCIDNYRFRASSYLDGIISRLVNAKLAESDPVSNEGKGKYRNPSFDYFKY
ncbi:gp49 homologous [Brachyspira pilosicoli]|uniref:phage replisome organizer N-terminal domain-containing protein n=1 Tax=Brachyspira pilosicoli TaxID=52584 RepID=UPI000E1A56EB|nr:phage replisome organizer N-terminal domain-containing protein [Brachyspira pilosicoli]SUW09076.1 gp49 homologous [Brachyspira pilosicoli]